MRRDDQFQFEPFRLRRGARQTIRLMRGAIGDGAKLVATRGRERFFETVLQQDADGAEFAEIDIGPDALEGYYTLVATPVNRKPVVIRNAFMVLDSNHHDGRYPMLESYEKWGYVIADDGVPMKDMAGSVGFVRHPLVVTYFLSAYYQNLGADKSRDDYRQGVLRLLDWLKAAVSDGPRGSLLLRHSFPLESFDLAPGWISGLTQGRVAECFLIGADITGDETYRQLAARMMEIYHVPVSEGGLLATDKLGHVSIEEYPSEPASWALNGIGSAIASLEKIAHAVGIDWADELVERVCDALEAKIPLFDAPDYPGSKVQLALKQRLGFAFRPSETSQAILAKAAGKITGATSKTTGEAQARLLSVRFAPPLSEPYTVCLGLDDESGANSVALRQAPVWRDGFVDGNIDCDDWADLQKTLMSIDVDAACDGVFVFYVKDAQSDAIVFEHPLKAGSQTIEKEIDWNMVYRRGAGRTARFDEYYHETNLAWMWNISRYGAKPRLTHTARRWLLSFYLGIGRLPHHGADIDASPLEQELSRITAQLAPYKDEPLGPSLKALSCKADSIKFILSALKREVSATCVYHRPARIENDNIMRVHIYGYGFDGRETIIRTDDDFPSADYKLIPVSGDEAILECKIPVRETSPTGVARVIFANQDGAPLPGNSTIDLTLPHRHHKNPSA